MVMSPELAGAMFAFICYAFWFWGIEVISRPTYASKPWKEDLKLVFAGLEKLFEIKVTDSCSHHVPITPGHTISTDPPLYTAEEVAKVMCGDLYWQSPLTVIVSASRKNNMYAMPLTSANKDLQARYDGAASGKYNWSFIFDHIFSYGHDIQSVARLGFGAEGYKPCLKYLSTSYIQLVNLLGTIEFRRLGGADSAKKAEHHIVFMLAHFMESMYHDQWKRRASTTRLPSVDAYIAALVWGRMEALPERSRLPGNVFKTWLEKMKANNVGAQPTENPNNKKEFRVSAEQFELKTPWAITEDEEKRHLPTAAK
ncbi:hypothetical protein B0T24DRAFT_702116 [Lasiosphaeria ovina]|uniref:Uncharacterized protein n=1 Tax=Lasiosphaeria ovina TaxID=92902 RepID=A0AAE0KBA2_9PEZI|nr:hypothetical protein B0T24DRAFT_702116 [Lasiosphaeria ovina]